MAIDPITGLEQEEIEVDTDLGGTETTAPITTAGGQQFTPAPGFDPTQDVAIPGVNLTPVTTDVPEPGDVTDLGIKDEVAADFKAIQDELQAGIDAGPEDITDITDVTEDITEDITDVTVDEGITGIEQIDTELDKLKEEKRIKLEETFDAFNIAKGQFEQNKEFYTNFDEVNVRFEGALADMRAIQEEQDITELTDEQLQIIATKNGLTLDEVKNPSSIFNQLELTEEGETKFGVDTAEDAIDKLSTDFERGKENIAFNLEGTRTSLINQIDDVKIQLARNIAFAEAQGAFTGAFKSSGFEQGIQNVRDDGQKTVDRLEKMLERVEQAGGTNLARLTEDFTKASAAAKKSLDSQLKDLKFDTGIQMSGLSEKFGLGTKELTKALDSIAEEFGTKSQKVFGDYVTNMRNIQQITNDNIIQQEKISALTDARVNKRFNELIANDGILLNNASLKGLQQNVANGTLSVQRFNDLKSIMQSSIESTLRQTGVLNTADISTIQTLLGQGVTPSEIVAQMQGLAKFKPTREITNEIKVGDSTVIQYSDGTQEILNEETLISDISDASVTDFIKTQEGFRGQAYLDSAGVATIGYGFTNINGELVKLGDTMTKQEAESELQNQLSRFQNFKALINVPLTENQKTALTSFEYNLGPNIWSGTGASIIDDINSGDLESASATMLAHNKARDPETGELRVLSGLTARRKREAGLLTTKGNDTAIGFKQNLTPLYGKFNSGKGFTSEDWKTVRSNGLTREQFTQQATNYLNSTQKEGSDQIKKLIRLTNDLATRPGRTTAAFGGGFIPFTDAADYKAAFDAFISNSALDNLINLKSQGATFGSLSNQELNFIKDASTSLKLNMSEDAFNREITRMQTLLAKGLPEGDTIQTVIGEETTTPSIPSTGAGVTIDVSTAPVGRWGSSTGNTSGRWQPE